jgi:hypothetical protein
MMILPLKFPTNLNEIFSLQLRREYAKIVGVDVVRLYEYVSEVRRI